MNTLTLFSGHSSTDYEKIIQCFQAPKRKYSSGDTIHIYGESQDVLGLLEAGSAVIKRVDIDGNITILEHLSAGGIFGEVVAFAPIVEDSVYVIAEEECTVLLLPYKNILHPCKENCDCHRMLIDNLFNLISQKTRELSERVEVLSCKTINEKLMRYFILLSSHQGSRQLTLPFSLSALANYICCDRSAMMRELKKMKEAGTISIVGREVSIIKQ